MGGKKALLIESARENEHSFAKSLRTKYDLSIAHSGKQGLERAQQDRPDVIVLDAVSLRTSGDRITVRLRAALGAVPIVHVRPETAQPVQSRADVVLHHPFTARKLLNRVEGVVADPEADSIEVGPFRLSIKKHRKLTPKLVELLNFFLEHPGETLERKRIMQAIWKTDYMGDTRTLDVHIRWLREAVEPEPRKPQYVTTVRGVGYCLRLPEQSASARSEVATAARA